MIRSQMRGFPSRGGRVSIKDRVGVPKVRGAVAKRGAGAGVAGKFVASRLGLPVKSRVGLTTKGATGLKRLGVRVGVGADARDKIILNRVTRVVSGGSGVSKVTDARNKIEARRKKVTSASGKVKSLKITAKLTGGAGPGVGGGGGPRRLNNNNVISSPPPPPTYRPMPHSAPSRSRYPTSSIQQTTSPAGYRSAHAHIPQPVSHGLFANTPDYDMPPPRPHQPPPPPSSSSSSQGGQSLFLTRTVTNYQASPATPANRGWASSVAKVAPSFSRPGQYEDMEIMDDEPPSRMRISNSLQSRLDNQQEDQPRYKLVVSNLQSTVTTEDIAELFSDIASPISATMTSAGHAEVIYSKKSDCIKAVDAYHNRLLDGMPMRVYMENCSTALKSAAGATMKLPKASSSIKIQPDISAIHKVLFNPSSSGNSTRGLFKGGQ